MRPSDPAPGAFDPALDAGLPALGWVRRHGVEDELVSEVRRRVRRRRACWLAAVAGGVVALLFAAVAGRPDPSVASTPTAVVSGPERRALPDGSTVELRAGAEVSSGDRAAARHVVLRRGEAHFQVGPQGRPFVVEARGVQIRTPGAAFAVGVSPASVEVVVTEGRVQVGADQAAPDADTGATGGPELRAGHRAVVQCGDGTLRVETLDGAELATRLAWRVPHLEFTRAPLGEVVELMNRHGAERTGVFFALGDPLLQDVVLTGNLRADHAEGLVRLLESQFDVYADRSEDTITLRRAP